MITKGECEAANELLRIIIADWHSIENCFTAAPKRTFLQREGKPEVCDDRWTLHVPRKSQKDRGVRLHELIQIGHEIWEEEEGVILTDRSAQQISSILSKLCSILVRTSCLLVLCSTLTVRAETFRNPYRIPTATDPSSIAAGDLNGDGNAGFIWIDSYNSPGTVKVILSQPSGGYLPGPDACPVPVRFTLVPV
jgi:hypothetical protein